MKTGRGLDNAGSRTAESTSFRLTKEPEKLCCVTTMSCPVVGTREVWAGDDDATLPNGSEFLVAP